MATENVHQDQLEWIFIEIATRARRAIELDRYADFSEGDALVDADSEKLSHIAYMGWLADVALTRMNSTMRQYDGDPIKWMLCPVAAEKLST